MALRLGGIAAIVGAVMLGVSWFRTICRGLAADGRALVDLIFVGRDDPPDDEPLPNWLPHRDGPHWTPASTQRVSLDVEGAEPSTSALDALGAEPSTSALDAAQ